ncbi:hypothetical protein Poli38472_008804 [Pythium oligandrum]|uniref:Cation-transporting P-type ATPase N-terminal domain-containing protein n=1 Tax=Pythium oligandrum TaxID=41045 RepID=A0A8K1C489_PYTOL|nr:hypothetical protein Poli38472_008804 [Pythium oligandrum]|eukprot:TMW56156.1 hypothetical protein Poli38472_008804 [Pythium oligandrum]
MAWHSTQEPVASPRANGHNGAFSPRVTANYMELADTFSTTHPTHDEPEEPYDHRTRFLSDAERLLAEHPTMTRESMADFVAGDKKWHTQPAEVVVALLKSNIERGLATLQWEQRIAEVGPNKLQDEPRAPLYVVLLLQFYNLIMFILLFAAIASFALGKVIEGTAVLIIMAINAIVATIQENNATNALEALAQMASPTCVAIRDGEQMVTETSQLVPGDLVVLVTGDVVPADIRLIESTDLKVNEMLLTGESEDVAKKHNMPLGTKSTKLTADNMVFSSTTVTAGNARGMVVETAMNTRVGSIAALLKAKKGYSEGEKRSWNPVVNWVNKYRPKMTPLQHSLHKLGLLIGSVALVVCVLVFIVGMIRGNKDIKDPDRPVWLAMLMVAVSLAVSAVPEGLPMVVTICLSVGTATMVKKQVLVRKLAAVETLGAASVICTDKTGTLTEGKMTAVKMWGDFKTYDITGKGFNPEGGIFFNGVNQAVPESPNLQVRSTLLASVLCSNTQLKQQEVDGVMTWVPFGNSSEAPLIVAAAKAGIWEEYVANEYPRVAEIPFSSSRKMMITVNALPDSGKLGSLALGDKAHYVACVKGAPNYILDNCTRYCQTDGTFVPLSEEQRDEVMDAVDQLSSKALRVLAVAIRPMSSLPYDQDNEDTDARFTALAQPLVLLGLMASIDPERDGVREAIATARRASIRTVMITGDYLKTAVAIAKNIDLLQIGAKAEDEATDCSRLRPRGEEYLPDHEIDEITSRTLVFARAKPEDKIEIVKSLQRQGLIAAMTGDGVNDAPALKEADIGVAMGISGTEVAKGASDMILLDDNFVSIVTAVEKGRVVYSNIQKFIMFLFSTNIGEILLIFATIAVGLPMPLQPLQILVLNLFTDGMPGAALSMEKGEPMIMEARPRPKKQSIIHGRLWFLVGVNVLCVISGICIVFVLSVYWNFGTVLLNNMTLTGTGPIGDDYRGITCKRWEGMNDGWRIYGNCEARFENGTYLFPDLDDRSFYEDDDMVCYGGDYECLWDGVARAQTMTFISLAFTEVLRAYTVRSFTQSMFVSTFSNKHLNLASVASLALTIIITNTPVLKDKVFGFASVEWFHWLITVAAAFNATFWSEIIKWIVRRRDRENARWEAMREGFDSVLFEIRHVRNQMERERENK